MGKKNFINLALFATIGLLSLDAFADVKTCVHGNSAQFETPDRAGTVLYKGWGIDFGKSGVSNWIHYSIPVRDPNLKLKSLSIKFYLGSHDVMIKDVHLYNANVKVHTANDVNWNRSGWSTKTIILPLLKSVSQGLGVSLQTAAGVESMSKRVVISSVCGTFQ